MFSVIQRKVRTPNDFASLQAIVDRLDATTTKVAAPFAWTFTRDDLETLIARVALDEAVGKATKQKFMKCRNSLELRRSRE